MTLKDDKSVCGSMRDVVASALDSTGWSQAELSRRSGLPPAVISRILSEKRSPTSGHLDRIAHAFGRNAREMFGSTDVASSITAWVPRVELEMLQRELDDVRTVNRELEAELGFDT